MSIGAHMLFYAGYALAALTVGLAIDQLNGQSADALVGSLAFFAACAGAHAGVAVWHAAGLISQSEKQAGVEVARLRGGHRDLVEELDSVAARLDDLDARIDAMMKRETRVAVPPAPKAPLVIDGVVDRQSKAPDASADATPPGAADVVRAALMANRVQLHLQPIVSLPQRRTVFYEAFTRLKDESGRLIMPHEFIPAAERAGLMWQIDNLLLFRCAQLVRQPMRNGRKVGVFCNISLAALTDERFFASFLAFARNNRDLSESLIFEIPQSAFERRTSVEARAMARLAEYGFRFSIDKVSRIDMDLPDLERANVCYLKVPARVIVEQMVEDDMRPRSNATREIEACEVSAVCARHGVSIVAERIESEEALHPLLDLDISLAQGMLFGAPRAIRDDYVEDVRAARPAHGRRAIA
jgi:cyclic-di-GMP phosphodiesterase TipF (flagellum assembly factor)